MQHARLVKLRRAAATSLATLGCALWGTVTLGQTVQAPDIRDLAALMLFNGSQGGRAFDTNGPIADDDAVWSRDGVGSYSFSSRRAGVTIRGSKIVAVEGSCSVSIATKFEWLFANKPAETLVRSEAFDFRGPVIADAILASQGDRPFAVILDLKGQDGFYCKSTIINGQAVESRQCSQAIRMAVGPGREDSPVLQYFSAFSKACRG